MELFPTWVLLFTALALGLRHGLDWDHISAIMDITSGQGRVRHGVVLGWFYAAGHGTVVGALGSAAILMGLRLSPAVDQIMTYVVGASLIVLGLYIINRLVRHPREEFQMRCRCARLTEQEGPDPHGRSGKDGPSGVDLEGARGQALRPADPGEVAPGGRPVAPGEGQEQVIGGHIRTFLRRHRMSSAGEGAWLR
jgi:ABC-type nickel/cobalt efflux system permease component RcnA